MKMPLLTKSLSQWMESYTKINNLVITDHRGQESHGRENGI